MKYFPKIDQFALLEDPSLTHEVWESLVDQIKEGFKNPSSFDSSSLVMKIALHSECNMAIIAAIHYVLAYSTNTGVKSVKPEGTTVVVTLFNPFAPGYVQYLLKKEDQEDFRKEVLRSLSTLTDRL